MSGMRALSRANGAARVVYGQQDTGGRSRAARVKGVGIFPEPITAGQKVIRRAEAALLKK